MNIDEKTAKEILRKSPNIWCDPHKILREKYGLNLVKMESLKHQSLENSGSTCVVTITQ